MMDIKYITMTSHPGNLTRIISVVEGDKTAIAEDVRLATEHPEKWELVLKKKEKKRSKDANAYMWELIEKIAKATGSDKITVYKKMLMDFPGISDIYIIEEQAVEDFINVWTKQGIGWSVEEIPCDFEGKRSFMAHKGSSAFNSEQMARFIDSLIDECLALKIDTLSPRDRALLKGYGNG